MESRRGDANEYITHRDRATIDQLRAVDRTDDEPGQVVLTVGVEPRHFRRLTAEQCAPVVAARGRHPANDTLGDRGQESSRRKIVEEKERFGSLNEDVVHAMVYKIDTHGVVAIRQERHLELRA